MKAITGMYVLAKLLRFFVTKVLHKSSDKVAPGPGVIVTKSLSNSSIL